MILPPIDVESTLAARFEQVVHLNPTGIALSEDGISLSYANLNRRANQIAHWLRSLLGETAAPVVVLCSSNLVAAAALFGIWKAGHFAIPLDSHRPRQQIVAILQSLGCRVVLCDTAVESLTASLQRDLDCSLLVINIDSLPANLSTNNLGLDTPSTAYATILFTSGSTGTPKGVIRNHRMLLNDVRWVINQAEIRPGDAVAHLYHIAHSAALNDMLRALLSGATVACYDLRARGLIGLARWLQVERIVYLRIQKAILGDFLETLPVDWVFSYLRYIRLAGLRRSDAEQLFLHLTASARIDHTLSSTETGHIAGWLLGKETQWDGPVVPVGYPVEDVEIILLDDAGQPIEGEGVGLMEIRSAYMACGYWNEADEQVARFRADPTDSRYRYFRSSDIVKRRADGMYEWVGRADNRIKIRGYSVDVTGVDVVLADIPSVRQAVVVVNNDSDPFLVAYVVPNSPDCTSSSLRRELHARLPSYAVPSRIVLLERFPLLFSGKIDYVALSKLAADRRQVEGAYVAPSTPIEQVVVGIWTDILGLNKIGIHDPFLDLGGNSLQAMRIAARVQDEFGVEISLFDLYMAATIAEMALLVVMALANEADVTPIDAS